LILSLKLTNTREAIVLNGIYDFTKILYLKMLLDTDLKIILSQNNYAGQSSIISNAAKSFDILATSLNVLYNYFNKKINFKFIFS